MKRYNSITTLILLLLSYCFYCCESFTEVAPPQTQLTAAAIFENVNTASAAISDIYARLREDSMVSGSFEGLSSLMSNYSDELTFYGSSPDLEAFYNHTVNPSNTKIKGMWNNSYGQIYATNAFLEGLANSNAINPENKDQLQGEALFLRAYIHFYLLNIFGDIPYITTTDYIVNSSVARMPQSEVWDKIKTDLTGAESLIADKYSTVERVNPNKSVVRAMLARVSLYTQDWEKAESYATSVIENPAYVWETNLASEFLKGNPSIIWSLHSGRTGFNTQDAKTFVSSLTPPIKSTLAVDFVNSFEPADLRKTSWVRTVTNGTTSWYQPYKYKKTGVTAPSQEYTILFRLAELYLIRAEARIHMGNETDAIKDINKIRSRAGLTGTTALGESALLAAVAKERKFELFTEQGHRWLDLKRTSQADKVLSAIKSNWQQTQVLLPLPEAELLLNSKLLPQNPGY
ncbi:RagB/SusD family nutrient uptake outer membrane protein [Flavobacterium sp. GT3P67]|uniref:RagB/SusD family nutrient uptake outer membrane protein n=1 Tax=Flavobacterium sp. GT3P67 TaxID=2541722 RepID=UPI001043BAE6|nr:RagB/SusD family nutrient uptake outer membrane protein [Flavobacterium sp. GT3P67]TDE51268.1 RagB/SusD family nutrient uptake outer membrane protein [Flavobacterium sp. GT3P67]